MTELEKKIRAKIPGPDTGIEIRHSICDICTPGAHCGLDVYVKDSKILKVEGTKGFPGSNGKLCTKGASNRQYVYRKNRLKYPMRRTGPRGSGQFERITWEEAYTEIAARLNAIKAEYGPESVAWYTRLRQVVPPLVAPDGPFLWLPELWHRVLLLPLRHRDGMENCGRTGVQA